MMAKYMGNAQKVWIEGIQTRVDVTASMLGAMKVIVTTFRTGFLWLIISKSVKMLGFTSILTNIIQGLRVTELRLSSLFRRFLCVRVFLGITDYLLLATQADVNI